MKIKLQILFFLLIFSSFTLKAQDVKSYSDIVFTDSNTVANFNNAPYTGVVIDKDSAGNQTYEGSYKNGLRDGIITYWNSSGQKLSEISYKNGVLDGNWITYSNGVKRYVDIYVNGFVTENQVFSPDNKQDSIWTYYTSDGRIQKTESFSNGVKEGATTTYDLNGNATTNYYHNGVLDAWSGFIVGNATVESLKGNSLINIPDGKPVKDIFGALGISRVGKIATPHGEGTNINPGDVGVAVRNAIIYYRGINEINEADYKNHPSDTVTFNIVCNNISVKVYQHLTNMQWDGRFYATIEFDLEKYLVNPVKNVVTLQRHITVREPNIGIEDLAYATEEDAFNATLQKNNNNGISSQVHDFIFTGFPVYSSVSQTSVNKPGDSDVDVQISNGKNMNLGTDCVMDVYEPGNPTPLAVIVTKDVSENSADCKVRKGSSAIASKNQSGVKLYSATRTQ